MYDKIYEAFLEVGKDNINKELFNNSEESAEDVIEDIKNNKIVIYTAFTGGYDSLKEPEFIDENCDYVCFTDDLNLNSDFWEIRLMDDSLLDNNRKAKQFKVLPHKYFPEYKYSFWLDGTFKIKGSLREYIYKNIRANSNMLCVVHTERDCIYDEFKASIIPRYPRSVMEEQINTYKDEGFPTHYGLGVMGSIFRKHNSQDVIELMDAWWEEIIKFTNQDQLSFSYVCWKCDFHPSVSLIYYWENKYWSKETKSDYHHKIVPVTPITSDILIDSIRDKVFQMDLGETLELSREELYLLINDVKGLAGYKVDTTGRILFLSNEKQKILSSNSMKLTKPLRFITNIARKVRYTLKTPKKKFLVDKITDLGIFKEDNYLSIHPDARDAIYHFVTEGSKSDSLETKENYIDPIFDLFYYVNEYNIGEEDPLIHFIKIGFKKGYLINRDLDFIKNLESIKIQYGNFLKDEITNELFSNKYITDSNVLVHYLSSDETFKTDTIKVGVFLEDSYDNMNACPYIRLHALFKKLSESGDYHFFVYGKELLPVFENKDIINNKIFDVIVIQRFNYYSNTLIKQAKRHGIKLVYEIDDDLINITHDHPDFNYFFLNKDKLINIIYNADAITVSTNSLKEKIVSLDVDNITVIKNYYLNEILPAKFSNNNSTILKIGYFGTLTHNDDFKLIENVFKRLKDEGYHFHLEIIGAISDNKSNLYESIPLPFYPMSLELFYTWLSKIVDWDIGVIPLVNNEFNRGKSELKFIEFTALGVPVIASPLPSYAEAIEDGVTGFLASNDEEWVLKLKSLIDHADLRKHVLANARKEIFEKYNIVDRVDQWDELLKNLFS